MLFGSNIGTIKFSFKDNIDIQLNVIKLKRAYPVQRAPALYGVWKRVLVVSLTLACAMRGGRDLNPGPSGRTLPLAPGLPFTETHYFRK